jgi:hypothetical protein
VRDTGLIRMMALRRYGPITHSKKKMAPDLGLVADRGGDAIAKAGLKLLGGVRVDEAIVRRHPRRLPRADHENAPEDYRRILECFSLFEAEVWRHESADEVSDP